MRYPAVMVSEPDRQSRHLVSLVREDGTLELSVAVAEVPRPGPDEVVVRVEAAPINPSDLLLFLAGADPTKLGASGSTEAPVLRGTVPLGPHLAGRLGVPMPLGNEGAGTVVEAGSSPAAQALLGRVVAAAVGGGMYAERRLLRVDQVVPMNPGTTAIEAASACINPLTILGFLGTMRREGHRAIANTAAASNLGQMLVRLCRKDGVPLVNVVRRPEQASLLRERDATHVVDSSRATFVADLTEAFAETGVTLAFDAIGGGETAGQLFTAMEAALARKMPGFHRYGTPVHKQVYVYGGLDVRPTPLARTWGLAWGMGGWLMTPWLLSQTPAEVAALRRRIADEVTTTFASPHVGAVGLAEALRPEVIAAYAKRATGEKYLVLPNG